jgi:anti-sigma-K factor RskA
MNIANHPDLCDKLAASYALGTLKGGARRRFEDWIRADARVRALAAEWQERIAPLSELGAAVAPPARVWAGIEGRLRPVQTQAEAPWWQFWRNPAARPWGGIALAAGAAALALGVLLAGRPAAPALQQLATLTDEQARTALVVAADRASGRLEVRVARGLRVPDDRTLQLWAIDTAGKPRSLGILPDNRSASLALDEGAVGAGTMLLAVSLEPRGGSPNPDAPTGPVLYKGAWVRL